MAVVKKAGGKATALKGDSAKALGMRRRVRKNMDMDQAKLEAAKAFFGAESETDAVNAALDLAVFQSEVSAGIEKMVRAGGLADVFDE